MVRIKHCDKIYDVKLVAREYVDGRLAVQLDRGSETYWTVSANVPEVPLAGDEFIAKTYSENEGIIEQLAAAGLVKFVQHKHGWPVYRLNKT